LADLRVYANVSNATGVRNVVPRPSTRLQTTGVLMLFVNSYGKTSRINIPVIYQKRDFTVIVYALDGRMVRTYATQNLSVSIGNNDKQNQAPLKGAYLLRVKTDLQDTDRKLLFF